jgi:hypothetical protein
MVLQDICLYLVVPAFRYNPYCIFYLFYTYNSYYTYKTYSRLGKHTT